MATFTSLLPHVLPDVAGCPNPVAIRALRNAAIDFCNRSEAWTFYHDNLTPVADVPFLEFDVPEGTRAAKILALSYNDSKLDPTSETLLDNTHKGWRSSAGNPEYFYKVIGDKVRLVPKPVRTEPLAVEATLALTPTQTAEGVDDVLVEQYLDAFIAGALNRLMSMRDQPWSNANLAAAHGMQFEEHITEARREARGDNYAKQRTTRYGGY